MYFTIGRAGSHGALNMAAAFLIAAANERQVLAIAWERIKSYVNICFMVATL